MNKITTAFIFVGLLCLIFLGNVQHAVAQENPPIPAAPQGTFILDTLDWLTPEQEAEINSINKNLDHDGTAQIAVVTLDDCGTDKKQFRHDLFNRWGIGHADDDDGLLILACWYGGDQSRRSIEQQVGYGLESTLTSSLTERVAKELFIPSFEQNKPGNGLVKMVSAYSRQLRTIPPANPPSRLVENQQPAVKTSKAPTIESYNIPLIAGSVAVGLSMLFAILLRMRRVAANRSAHPSKKDRQREAEERKRLFFLWGTLVIFTISAFIVILFNGIIGIVLGAFAEVVLIIIQYVSYPYRSSSIKKDNPKQTNQNVSWFSNGDSSNWGGGGGNYSGGGGDFGGGSSGDGGSSSDF